MTAADVLRAAALLIEQRIAVTAHGAIHLAVCGGPEGFQPRQPFDVALYEQARDMLANHLPYPPGQDPKRLLTRWSNATTPADMMREMRAAADTAARNTR